MLSISSFAPLSLFSPFVLFMSVCFSLCMCLYVCLCIYVYVGVYIYLFVYVYMYISRIRRNLSIHIDTQNSPIFAGRLANRLRGWAVCVTTHALASQASAINSLLAFVICCVHYNSRLFNLFLPFYLHFMHLFLLLPFCD